MGYNADVDADITRGRHNNGESGNTTVTSGNYCGIGKFHGNTVRTVNMIRNTLVTVMTFVVYLTNLRLRNDLYCVEWGVKLYSLTHSLTHLTNLTASYVTLGSVHGRSECTVCS